MVHDIECHPDQSIKPAQDAGTFAKIMKEPASPTLSLRPVCVHLRVLKNSWIPSAKILLVKFSILTMVHVSLEKLYKASG